MSVEFLGPPTGEGTFDRRGAVDEGRARHFPCAIPSEERDRNMIEVGRAVNHVEHDGGDLSIGSLPSEVPPHVPMLLLSEDGTIQDLTKGARRLLEHPPDASIEPLFFAHVHGRNLQRVMQDLAQMASRRRQRTRWLLRLRTGNGRWRWYRARATRVAGSSDHSVRVLLQRL